MKILVTKEKLVILGISGSPRLGATHYMVKYALDLIKEKAKNSETHYFSASRKTINFCIHCDHCVKTKQGCVHGDDMKELYPLMEKADGWIIGTPIYQGTLSAQTKAILDRCRALVARDLRVFENKVGAAIGVGGDRMGGQEIAIQAILNFYIINNMIPVGGGSFGANLGATIWSKDKMAQGAQEDVEGQRTVKKLVGRFLKVIKNVTVSKE